MKSGYVKITFEDIEIAKNFFENEKHLDEFMSQVCRYYCGYENVFKYNNVKKFFETYKKTMNRVMLGRSTGSIGGKKRVENQQGTSNTLEGVLEGGIKGPVKPKERKEINLIKEIEIKENKDFVFESLWKDYPNKDNKKKAKEKFLKLDDKDIELVKIHLPIFSVTKKFATYNHPQLIVYLNQERFRDEIEGVNKEKPKQLWVKVRLGNTIQDFIKSSYDIALKENKLNCNNPEVIKEYYK